MGVYMGLVSAASNQPFSTEAVTLAVKDGIDRVTMVPVVVYDGRSAAASPLGFRV